MFIRPELRKGDIDVRVKAPKDLVDKDRPDLSCAWPDAAGHCACRSGCVP